MLVDKYWECNDVRISRYNNTLAINPQDDIYCVNLLNFILLSLFYLDLFYSSTPVALLSPFPVFISFKSFKLF